MNETEERWLSITEICKYLGVSNDTVYKWIDRHGMPAHRMGRLWKFKKARWMRGSNPAARRRVRSLSRIVVAKMNCILVNKQGCSL
ncbi:helix-turn-helix domain-containing protein [Desulfatirhabdium butyrativorans]|uniref:helix-turn-helix domain-containing protein n=1 Tax=Desulfatirhabdium butyrativorans TaxID=340467 RepID=UPI003CCC109E